jgi:hypothetical protein
MARLIQASPSPLLRAVAEALLRLADRMERPACLPLEPLLAIDCADERVRERRHQVFTRYY